MTSGTGHSERHYADESTAPAVSCPKRTRKQGSQAPIRLSGHGLTRGSRRPQRTQAPSVIIPSAGLCRAIGRERYFLFGTRTVSLAFAEAMFGCKLDSIPPCCLNFPKGCRSEFKQFHH